MQLITKAEGRRAFGEDPKGYDQARPDYPNRLYEILEDRCGAGPGTRAFEVGPGSGRFTQRFLSLGIHSLVAVEPDPRLAQFLKERFATPRGAAVRIENSAFEEADLEPGTFDLGVAATSFHWLDAVPALAKVHNLLRPGGSWAMWWTVFSDPAIEEPFMLATDSLFKDLSHTPSHGHNKRQAYGLDIGMRTHDLSSASFVDIVAEPISWQMTMTTDAVVALAATFSPVILLPPEENASFLSRLRRIVDEQFGGVVDRRFVTAVYTARRAS